MFAVAVCAVNLTIKRPNSLEGIGILTAGEIWAGARRDAKEPPQLRAIRARAWNPHYSLKAMGNELCLQDAHRPRATGATGHIFFIGCVVRVDCIFLPGTSWKGEFVDLCFGADAVFFFLHHHMRPRG